MHIVSVCVRMCLAFFIHRARRIYRIIFPSLVCLVLPYFSTSSHKLYHFRKEIFKNKICVLIFSIILAWNISLSKKKSPKYYHKCKTPLCNIPVVLVRFYRNLHFLEIFFLKILRYQFSLKSSSRSRVIPCWRTDRQTDRQT